MTFLRLLFSAFSESKTVLLRPREKAGQNWLNEAEYITHAVCTRRIKESGLKFQPSLGQKCYSTTNGATFHFSVAFDLSKKPTLLG